MAINGQQQGPFTAQQLADGIAKGQIARDTLVWTTGMGEWAPAGQVPQIASAFAHRRAARRASSSARAGEVTRPRELCNQIHSGQTGPAPNRRLRDR